jgi:hypothetical protein
MPEASQVLNEMLRYAEDSYDNPDLQKLEDYYAWLITTAFDKQRIPSRHPAFRQIITQITSDEAIFFKALCDVVCLEKYSEFRYEPIMRIVVNRKDKSGEFVRFRNVCIVGFEAGCMFPEKSSAYI